jgi:hypothetical protein
MTLNIKAVALTCGILWAACFVFVGLANVLWPPYGDAVLQLGAAVYPGYHGAGGAGALIVLMLYALVDGTIFGAVAAWLYNTLAGGMKQAAT